MHLEAICKQFLKTVNLAYWEAKKKKEENKEVGDKRNKARTVKKKTMEELS